MAKRLRSSPQPPVGDARALLDARAGPDRSIEVACAPRATSDVPDAPSEFRDAGGSPEVAARIERDLIAA